MTKDCPSNFVLDAFRLGFDERPAGHVRACPDCTAWLSAQAALESRLAPRWSTHGTSRRRWRALVRALWLGLPLAVGAVALFLFVKPKPPTETAKGGIVVEIARLHAGTLSWLTPTDELMPRDSLRFFVHRQDAEDRYVLIGSVDGSQRLAQFYPPEPGGCSIALPAGADALEGSIVIDDTPGPERIVVVVSHRPLCWPDSADDVRRIGLGEARSRAGIGQDTQDIHTARLVFPKGVEAAP